MIADGGDCSLYSNAANELMPLYYFEIIVTHCIKLCTGVGLINFYGVCGGGSLKHWSRQAWFPWVSFIFKLSVLNCDGQFIFICIFSHEDHTSYNYDWHTLLGLMACWGSGGMSWPQLKFFPGLFSSKQTTGSALDDLNPAELWHSSRLKVTWMKVLACSALVLGGGRENMVSLDIKCHFFYQSKILRTFKTLQTSIASTNGDRPVKYQVIWTCP